MGQLLTTTDQVAVEGVRGALVKYVMDKQVKEGKGSAHKSVYQDLTMNLLAVLDQIDVIAMTANDPPHKIAGANIPSEEEPQYEDVMITLFNSNGSVYSNQVKVLYDNLGEIFRRVLLILDGADASGTPIRTRNSRCDFEIAADEQNDRYFWSLRFNVMQRALDNLQTSAQDLENNIETHHKHHVDHSSNDLTLAASAREPLFKTALIPGDGSLQEKLLM